MEIILEKKKILEDIREMKNGSYEQMFLITIYSLNAYFKSLFAFGCKSKITKDNLNIIQEMFRILKTERLLLNYIIKHINEFDTSATERVIAMLDEANDESVHFYYDVINDIEDAAELGEEHRGIRRKQNCPSLIQSSSYAKEVVALSENLDNLKNFLGFDEGFWDFIKDDIKVVNTSDEIEEKVAYASPLLDNEGNVVKVLILVPKIVDLSSALLAIKIYRKAYDIYLMLGKPYDKSRLQDASSLQQAYNGTYILNKAQNLLNKKM